LDLRRPHSVLTINFFLFFYLVQGKSINEIYKIMVKTLDAIRQMVFDLEIKVKIVKEKKTTHFSTQKTVFFLLRINVEIMNGLTS
jgi:hypothetical protein